jgi:ketosteroid isomerase-like protein
MADANVATLRAGYDALSRGDVSDVMARIADDTTWDPGELTRDRDAEASPGIDGEIIELPAAIDAGRRIFGALLQTATEEGG